MFTNALPSSSKLYKINFKLESQTKLRTQPSKTMNVKASLGDWGPSFFIFNFSSCTCKKQIKISHYIAIFIVIFVKKHLPA